MIQDKSIARKRMRQPVPIIPTLVIGVGKYGREVGIQLAARLLLTEDGLHEAGLSKPLLVRTDDNGNVTPGFIRIMELDWDQWFAAEFKADMLLTDIEISGPSVADEGTQPRQREDERHPDDWIEAKNALPKTVEHLFDISLPLRTHDTPLKLGNFLPQGKDQNFAMRVYVVCAAREADSAALVPELIRLLGQAYVTRTGLAKGLQMLCYVGGTSRVEHLKANGDEKEYDLLLDTEVTRVLPKCLRAPVPAGTPQMDSLLDYLEQIGQHASPQIIEVCYLIDTQLANLVAAVQNRVDEPNEAIIASALAINMFISSGGDATIRRAISRRWDLADPHSEPGPFATLGVASYALDHPKLRRLVYNYVTGMFLLHAQPVTYGDRSTQRGTFAGYKEEELLNNPQLETQLNYKIHIMLDEYEKSISFKSIERKLPKGNVAADKKLDYKKAVVELEQVDAGNRAKIKEVLERVTDKLADDMGENALKLRAQKRQLLYLDELADASFTGAIGRALLIAPVLVALILALSPLWGAVSTMISDWFGWFNVGSSFFTTVYNTLYALPAWVGAAALVPPLLASIFFGQRRAYRKRIRHQLNLLVKKFEAILKEADQEAWRWALAQTVMDKEELEKRVKALSRPGGIVSNLRDTLLAEEFGSTTFALGRINYQAIARSRQDRKVVTRRSGAALP